MVENSNLKTFRIAVSEKTKTRFDLAQARAKVATSNPKLDQDGFINLLLDKLLEAPL